MQTRKLYYENCHLFHFQAGVTGCEHSEKGYLVTLDATAFYPEGGGQACDLGTLADATVLDVQEKDGRIFHLCDRPLAVGTTVVGQIDSARRLDLMQQHSGEHIVSGIICKMFGCHNVGFHVGKDVMEIDFDTGISPEMLPQIELLANEAIWKDLPVECGYPDPQQLSTLPYRSKKALDWPVRIVRIPDYDICACCGVHVANTGEIGLIKLLSCVKLRQGVRIEMVCGRRAFLLTQRIFAQNQGVSQAFSAKPEETAMAARKTNETLSAWKLKANTLQTEIFRLTARKYCRVGNALHFEENLTGNWLRELAEDIAAVCGGWAAVVTDGNGGCDLCIIGGDLSELLAALKTAFPTRGGGRPGSFQGSVAGERAAIIDFFRQQGGYFVENYQ